MWGWLLRFCSGDTDVNENGIPDNEELLRMIEILSRKLDAIKADPQ